MLGQVPQSPKVSGIRTFDVCWYKFFTGQMPFLSLNRQYQSSKRSCTVILINLNGTRAVLQDELLAKKVALMLQEKSCEEVGFFQELFLSGT